MRTWYLSAIPDPKLDLAAEWKANEELLAKLPDNHADTQRLLERQDEIEYEAGEAFLKRLKQHGK